MEPSEPQKLDLPDTTKIQIVAVVQAVLAVAIAFGVPISDSQSVALIALAGLLGTVLIGADAAIRRSRAAHADKLRPQVQLTTTDEEGTRVTATVPMTGEGDESQDELEQQILELVRKILDTRNGDQRRPARPRTRRTRTRA